MPGLLLSTWGDVDRETLDALNSAHDYLSHNGTLRGWVWNPSPWWQQLAPGAQVRVTDTSAAVYSDAAGGTLRRKVGQGEVLDVWRSLKAGATWSGGRVCVFASAGLELWVDAAAVGMA